MDKKLNCHSTALTSEEILNIILTHKEKLKYEYLPHFTWTVGMCETETELKEALDSFYENCEILNRKKNKKSFISFQSENFDVLKKAYAELKKSGNKGKELVEYNSENRFLYTFKSM